MKTLKHIPYTIAVALCAFTFTACEKEELPELELQAELNMAYEDIAFTIPANEFTGLVDMELDFDPAELEAMLTSNGYSMDDLKAVHLTGASIHTMSDSATLQGIGSVELRMLAGGYLDRLVASVPSVSGGAQSVTLNTGGENLLELFQFDDARLKVVGELIAAMQQDLPLRASIHFRVVVSTRS